MKFVDEDCGEEKAVSLNATECYEPLTNPTQTH